MLRSLVGSEMCIRDRPGIDGQAQSPLGGAGPAPAQAAMAPETQAPVAGSLFNDTVVDSPLQTAQAVQATPTMTAFPTSSAPMGQPVPAAQTEEGPLAGRRGCVTEVNFAGDGYAGPGQMQSPLVSNAMMSPATPQGADAPNVVTTLTMRPGKHAEGNMGCQKLMNKPSNKLNVYSGSPVDFKKWAETFVNHMARVHIHWRYVLNTSAGLTRTSLSIDLCRKPLGQTLSPPRTLQSNWNRLFLIISPRVW